MQTIRARIKDRAAIFLELAVIALLTPFSLMMLLYGEQHRREEQFKNIDDIACGVFIWMLAAPVVIAIILK